jgi:hypothetical protein
MPPVTDQQDLLSLRLARYGVPAVILVFYLAAALRFGYTPEGTFLALGQVAGVPTMASSAFVSPLWTGMIMGGRAAGIDPLLAAKVLSLLFTSITLLTTFLVAVEILRDRFLGFAVVLMVGVESWLTQVAVSGHPFALGMMLVMGAVFFLQRNEYPVSAVLTGLASLVFWQALLLLLVLAADAVANSAESGLGRGRAMRVVAAAGAVVLTWPAIALVTGQGILAWMPPPSVIVPASAIGTLVYALCGVGWVTGMVLLHRKGEHGHRVILALLPAIGPLLILGVVSLIGGGEFWRMTIPLLFAGALFGIRLLLVQLRRLPWLYPAAFILAGLTLLHNQFDMQGKARHVMALTASQNGEIAAIAVWVRSHVGTEIPVASDRPATLMYYAGRPVKARSDSGAADRGLVVAQSSPGPGFAVVYRLPASPEVPEIPGTAYAVWKKQ